MYSVPIMQSIGTFLRPRFHNSILSSRGVVFHDALLLNLQLAVALKCASLHLTKNLREDKLL